MSTAVQAAGSGGAIAAAPGSVPATPLPGLQANAKLAVAPWSDFAAPPPSDGEPTRMHVGYLPSGRYDGITDVPGVEVDNLTIVRGRDIRDGATVVMPNADPWTHKVAAAAYTINGNGAPTDDDRRPIPRSPVTRAARPTAASSSSSRRTRRSTRCNCMRSRSGRRSVSSVPAASRVERRSGDRLQHRAHDDARAERRPACRARTADHR